MLELNRITKNFEQVVSGLEMRGIAEAKQLLENLIHLDDRRKETQSELDSILAESNQKSKSIGQLMQSGAREEAETLKSATVALKSQAKTLQSQLGELVEEIDQRLYDLPNIPNPSVPEGRNAEHNEVVAEWGQLPEAGGIPHWELGRKLGILDFELGSKVTGAGFPFYLGQGAKLQRALVSFFLDQAYEAGYHEVQPPLLVNQESGLGTGQLPDKEGQMYAISDSQFFLIPTAEVPLTNIYRGTLFEPQELPKKLVAYSACFRREAGSWGADVRGLNRLHQFDKVEIVQIQPPEYSYHALNEMCDHVKMLLEKLKLPYRILNLCAGDLGFTSAQTFDFEVFTAAQQKWLEVSSVSNFETYQSNRLKLRVRSEGKSNTLLHTLNGSALALPRIVAALMENNQSEKGITIPEVLRPYTGFELITT